MRWFASLGTLFSVVYWVAVFWLILGEPQAPPMRTFVAAMGVYAVTAWAAAWLAAR